MTVEQKGRNIKKCAIRFCLGLVSVAIASVYYANYWIVGPVFALAYLLMNFENVDFQTCRKYVLFLLASTLTYALVYCIAQRGLWHFKNDALDGLFGTLSAGVIVGSLQMPYLHGRLLGLKRGSALKGSLLLICGWYLTVVLSLIFSTIKFPDGISFVTLAIALWQATYFIYLK